MPGFHVDVHRRVRGTWIVDPSSSYTALYDDFKPILEGSPQIALEVDNCPFDRFIFIDNDAGNVGALDNLRSQNPNRWIEVIHGDANAAVPNVCCRLRWKDRAVVFLDPYLMQLNWATVERIAETRKIDCWILFPTMAIQRNMPRKQLPPTDTSAVLDRVFGGRRYWDRVYRPSPQQGLWGDERVERHQQIAENYRKRLGDVFCQVAAATRPLKIPRIRRFSG